MRVTDGTIGTARACAQGVRRGETRDPEMMACGRSLALNAMYARRLACFPRPSMRFTTTMLD